MDALQHTPALTRAEAATLAGRVYGLEVGAADLAATLDEVLGR